MSKNNSDIVFIQLDRPRELRYGHKALKQVVALTGRSLEEIETNFNDFELLEKLVYCGLRDKDGISQADMEDLLDQAPSYAHIIESVGKAFFAAFGVDLRAEGNQPQPEQAPAEDGSPSTLTSPAE